MQPVSSSTLLGDLSAAQIRLNPFRVLGLDVSAGTAEVRRAADKAIAQHRLGSSSRPGGPLPPPSAPDDDAVRRAAHQLRDPARRLLAELFWFEPDHGEGAARWVLDGSMPISQLEDVWGVVTAPRHEGDPTPAWPVRHPAAARNLAVLSLLRLADADADRPRGLDAAEAGGGVRSGGDWRDAPTWWSVWLATDTTPVKVQARARELGLTAVARMDAAEVRRLLTSAFVGPYLELVTEATDRGEDLSKAVAGGLTSGGLDAVEVRTALGAIAERAGQRIHAVVEADWERAQADPPQAQLIGLRLLSSLRPWTTLMIAADAPGRDVSACSPTVRSASHQFADMLLACAVNWVDPSGVDSLRTAHRLARAAVPFVAEGDPLFLTLHDRLLWLEATIESLKWYTPASPRPHAAPGPLVDLQNCLLCAAPALDSDTYIPVPMLWPAWAPTPPAEKLRRFGDLVPGQSVTGGLPRCSPCGLRMLKAQAAQRTWSRLGVAAMVVGSGFLGAGVVPLAIGLYVLAVMFAIMFWDSWHRLRVERATVLSHPLVTGMAELGYQLKPDWQTLRFVPDGRS